MCDQRQVAQIPTCFGRRDFLSLKNQSISDIYEKMNVFRLHEYRVFYILQRWEILSFQQENIDRHFLRV